MTPYIRSLRVMLYAVVRNVERLFVAHFLVYTPEDSLALCQLDPLVAYDALFIKQQISETFFNESRPHVIPLSYMGYIEEHQGRDVVVIYRYDPHDLFGLIFDDDEGVGRWVLSSEIVDTQTSWTNPIDKKTVEFYGNYPRFLRLDNDANPLPQVAYMPAPGPDASFRSRLRRYGISGFLRDYGLAYEFVKHVPITKEADKPLPVARVAVWIAVPYYTRKDQLATLTPKDVQGFKCILDLDSDKVIMLRFDDHLPLSVKKVYA